MNKRPVSPSLRSAPALSASGAALIDDLLRGGALRSDDIKTPEPSDLVRYLTGMLSVSERQDVESALITCDTSRALLRQVRPVLRRLQAASWQEVSRQAQASDFAGQVAQVWLTLLAERAAALPAAAAHKRLLGWEPLRREAMAGIQEAKIVWESWRTLGQRLRAELSRPRLAVAKGNATNAPLLSASLQRYAETAYLEARITPDDSLALELKITSIQKDEEEKDTEEKDTEDRAGDTTPFFLHFSLLLRGDPWYLGAAALSDGQATLLAPGLGTVLGLPPGTWLPAHLFSVARKAPVTAPTETLVLPAEIFEADGEPAALPAAEIMVTQSLHSDQEQIVLDVSLPALTRSVFASYALELDLMLFSEQGQHLGRWPISEWGEEPRTLHISCPGSPGRTPLPISILRARLTAGVTSEGAHPGHDRLTP